MHPFEAAQYFNPTYLLTHGLRFKEEKDVHLETGKRIMIYLEVVLKKVVDYERKGKKIPSPPFFGGGGWVHI